ncbi:MAG TPA: DUF72 domain-containing protein [bacterium]|nr:DUF72 domain-containing protein [bacterium]
MSGRIRIGTSGYSFPDWRGTVYPRGVPAARWLVYYAQDLGFDCVEINATYYRPLPARTYAGMATATPADFRFTIKGHRGFTHDPFDPRLAARPDTAAALAAAGAFAATLDPLRAAGKLAAVLLQFPVMVTPSPVLHDYLRRLREAFPDDRLVIEFRHRDWATAEQLAFLRAAGLAYCAVDEPPLPQLMPLQPVVTAAPGYLRLHGRNRNWFNAARELRYDYDYSPAELQALLPAVRTLADDSDEVFVFFNNCHLGKAARNARALQDLLGIVRPPATLF